MWPSCWLQGSIHRATEARRVIADSIRPFIGTRMMKNEVLLRCKRTRWHSVIRDSSIQTGGGVWPSYWLQGSIHRAAWTRPVIADSIRPFIGTRMMKNEVLLRCKRTRWHSVIRDSSIQTGGGVWPSYWLQGSIHRAAWTRPVIADLTRNPEGRRRVAVILASRQYPHRNTLM